MRDKGFTRKQPPWPTLAVAALVFLFAGQSVDAEVLDSRTTSGPALQIDESWRQYREVPSFFGEVADAPERFFYLSPARLHEIVKIALVENPELQQSEAEWHALLQKVRRVSALPDPNLAVTAFLESVETRVGPQEAAFLFTQKLPWFGKLSGAGQAAMEEALEKAWEWRGLQRATVLAIKEAYYDLSFLAEALRITEEDLATLRRYEEIALTRYATGRGIQQNVVKVQSEVTRLTERKIILSRQRDVARRKLAGLAGKPLMEIPLPEEGRSLPALAVDLQDLYGRVHAGRDELQARLHALRARQEEVKLAKKQYWPDLTLGFNYVIVGDRKDPAGILNPPEDDGKDAMGILASINLPIWHHKVRAGVDEARLKEMQARAAYARQEDSVIFEVQDAYVNVESLSEQWRLYEDTLMPQAMQSRDSSEAAYETGKLTFLELLDSERFLLAVRYGYAKVKSEYWIALARMERALGVRFPG
jgi:outer membrane protein TolC